MYVRFWDYKSEKFLDFTKDKIPVVVDHRNHNNIHIIEHEGINMNMSIGFDKNFKPIFDQDWIKTKDGELYLVFNNGIEWVVERYMIDYRCHCEECIKDNPDPANRCWTSEVLEFYRIVDAEVVGNKYEDHDLYIHGVK